MKTSPIWKFTIFDAMIVVAATAMGFALLRSLLTEGFLFRQESVITRTVYIAQCANQLVFPFLTAWTFAFLVMRLRQPRPPLRRLARQPGMAACSAASLVLIVALSAIVIPEIIWSVRAIG
jgi:hypothetical protein